MMGLSLTNPWVILGIIGAMAVVAIGSWQISATYTESAWQKREARLNGEAAQKIHAAEEAARAKEKQHATALAQVSADYQKQLQETANERNHALADVRAGRRRLSIPAKCPAPGDNLPGVVPGAGGRDGEARAELPPEAAEFLISEASRADAVVRQLAACQAVIEKDRR